MIRNAQRSCSRSTDESRGSKGRSMLVTLTASKDECPSAHIAQQLQLLPRLAALPPAAGAVLLLPNYLPEVQTWESTHTKQLANRNMSRFCFPSF